ncbi:VanZ family protein [Flavobacterium sp. NG2]|uniref:VanZ family protein n=1 Tax=Flavobacterium sp. NG2 TaxID=3097547 RepID=UPI002A802FDC|nr:VanZ family protein [Flavobacterium sp. NG2]WPR71792.1 VanZ family protein [Flavobacterium sp. NG2]
MAAVLWTSIVLVLCLIRLDGAPTVDVMNFDKYVHTAFHFIFTMLWYLYFRLHFKKENKYKPFIVSFVSSVLFGILIEILQQCCTASRAGDVFDVLANMLGASVAISLFFVLDNYKCLEKIS